MLFTQRNGLTASILLVTATFLVSGCVPGGGKKASDKPPPVYGPPQVIYQIDKNRYFTLENYTTCDNGITFYNNTEKNLHIQVSPSSGYLFKGRFVWLSSRDDYLAFPINRNNDWAVCMGSDKGCLKMLSVTVDGGKTMRSLTYGSYTDDPNGTTFYYDMIVTDEGFYMVKYDTKRLNLNRGSVQKWTFSPNAAASKQSAYPGVIGPEYSKELSLDFPDDLPLQMQCDRSLEPKKISEEKNNG